MLPIRQPLPASTTSCTGAPELRTAIASERDWCWKAWLGLGLGLGLGLVSGPGLGSGLGLGQGLGLELGLGVACKGRHVGCARAVWRRASIRPDQKTARRRRCAARARHPGRGGRRRRGGRGGRGGAAALRYVHPALLLEAAPRRSKLPLPEGGPARVVRLARAWRVHGWYGACMVWCMVGACACA